MIFGEDLIKGRIAEAVFELMFRENRKFDIYPLGYEHTIPILRQFRDHPDILQHKPIVDKIIDNFSDTPDFLLVKPDKSEIFTVEVKYLEKYDADRILEYAVDIKNKWNPSWLFLATPERFYFESCTDIVKNEGEITPLTDTWIYLDIQKTYLELLNRFEK